MNEAGELGGKMCALCGECCLPQAGNILHTVQTFSTSECKGMRFVRNVGKNEASDTAPDATDLNPQQYSCENLKYHVNTYSLFRWT